LYFAGEIGIQKSLFELSGCIFCFALGERELVYEMSVELSEHPIYLFITRKLADQNFNLTIETSDVFHIAGRDDIELGIEQIDLLHIACSWIVCQGVRRPQNTDCRQTYSQKKLFHTKIIGYKSQPSMYGFLISLQAENS